MDELFAQINAEIKFYEEESLEMNPPYASTMPELLKLIDMYYQG